MKELPPSNEYKTSVLSRVAGQKSESVERAVLKVSVASDDGNNVGDTARPDDLAPVS